MNHYDYIKHVMRKSANYTFHRMGFYLTLFNFFMLANWMYENTAFGDMLQSNGFRPGDTLLIILFAIFAISALEYVVIGRDKEIAQEQAQQQQQEQDEE
jgi:hypothetical protein